MIIAVPTMIRYDDGANDEDDRTEKDGLATAATETMFRCIHFFTPYEDSNDNNGTNRPTQEQLRTSQHPRTRR